MREIYLDYAATTPIHHEVSECMASYLTYGTHFGNAASNHVFGERANAAIHAARTQVASAIHAEPSEIIFTSGATEATNLAIKGIASLYKDKGNHLITLATEHKSVLDTCMHLEKEGFQVTYLKPDRNGLISLDLLKENLKPTTLLVTISTVNNETGVIQDIANIGKFLKEHNILFHTDAVQAIGKIKLDINSLDVDAISLSAHKVYGPKGIGALYLRKRPRIRVAPLLHGGGHEQGMRSGTLATHQIVGMGKAFELASKNFDANLATIKTLRAQFLNLLNEIPTIELNVDEKVTVPHIANLKFKGSIAEALLRSMPLLAASTSSACQEKSGGGSHVLRAMGFSTEDIQASIRFSFGLYLTQDQIINAADMIKALFKPS